MSLSLVAWQIFTVLRGWFSVGAGCEEMSYDAIYHISVYTMRHEESKSNKRYEILLNVIFMVSFGARGIVELPGMLRAGIEILFHKNGGKNL